MTLKQVNDEQFNAAILAKGVTLIEFGAVWCPPCRVLGPILDELDRETGPDISIVQVDVDESPAAASAFGVMSMPTVIVFKDGEPVEKLVGLRPKEQYRMTISRLRGEAVNS